MISRRVALRGLGGAALSLGLAGIARATVGLPITLDFDTRSQMAQGGWALGRAASPVSHLLLDQTPVTISADGRFLLGFDRDAPAQMVFSGENAMGARFNWPLSIAPGHWQLEQINAPFHPPALPDADFARIRAGELACITAARAKDTGATGWAQRFQWPVKGRISGRFGAQRIYRGPDGQPAPGSYHPGLDIATGQSGTPYVAPADGVVVLAASAPFTLEGNLLMLDHGMGLSSAFLHSESLLVAEGEHVSQGQPLGHIGMTGRATGPHLHWGLRWHEARLDPLLFVG